MIWKGILFVAALSAGLPATAREWPTTAGWDVVEGDDYCSIHLEYEGKGETELSVLLNTDDSVLVGLSNSGWSIEKGDRQDALEYGVNGKIYSGGRAVGAGDINGKKSFVTSFGAEFLADFSASSYLVVRKGEVLVDNLQLKGSAAALVVAKRCLAALKRDIAAAATEKRKFANIADDPFAKPGTPTPSPPQAPSGPIPRGVVADWFPQDSYPAAAMRAGAQGKASWEAEISPDGRVAACKITSSTGNADLDATTCRIAMRNGRFSGGPGVYRGATSWSLPEQ